MPVERLQGARQAVIVWKIVRAASALRKPSDWPAGTTGGRAAAPPRRRSPWP